MASQVEISPLSSTDVPEVVMLWNQTLTSHPISQQRFTELFFSPKLKLTAFVARSESVIGFAIAYQRNQPAPGLGLEPELGYFAAIGVAQPWQGQGIGSNLIKNITDALEVVEILLAGRTGSAPAAVFPGVDLDNYAAAVSFFEKNGFAKVATACSMSAEITQPIELELAAGVEVVTDIDSQKLAQFLAAAFPGDWADVALAKLSSNPTEMAVVSVNGAYAGFAVWNQGWFGPVGVGEDFRKYGLGKLLVSYARNQMAANQIDKIWFNWADEWVVPFYERLSFRVDRTYQRMNWLASK